MRRVPPAKIPQNPDVIYEHSAKSRQCHAPAEAVGVAALPSFHRVSWAMVTTFAALLILAGCSSTQPVDAETAASEPSKSSTSAPTSTSSSQDVHEPNVKALEIPAGLEPQQLGDAYIDLKNQWWNAGTEDYETLEEKFVAALKESKTLDEFAAEMAAENKEVYAPAMFGSDWENNPEAKDAVARMVESNQLLISALIQKKGNFPTNSKGYRVWSELTSAASDASTSGSRILQVVYTNHGSDSLPKDGSVIVDWKVIGDKEYAHYIR